MKAQTMRRLRQIHHYVGVFFAPAILLFSLSGAFQTFRLQEEKGYGGTPPGWIVWMASVHKDQSLPRLAAAGEPEGEARADHDADREHEDDHEHEGAAPPAGRSITLPLKIFVVLMSAGLITSTMLGLIIAFNNPAMRRASIMLVAAGAVLPLLLLLL